MEAVNNMAMTNSGNQAFFKGKVCYKLELSSLLMVNVCFDRRERRTCSELNSSR